VKPFPHPPKREEKEIARTHPEPDHPPTESDLHLLPLCPLFLFFFFPPFLLPSLPAPNPSLPTGNPTERKKPKTNRKKKKKRKEKEKKKKRQRRKKQRSNPTKGALILSSSEPLFLPFGRHIISSVLFL
jgi:type IV secretory pathway VirB10-like protein